MPTEPSPHEITNETRPAPLLNLACTSHSFCFICKSPLTCIGSPGPGRLPQQTVSHIQSASLTGLGRVCHVISGVRGSTRVPSQGLPPHPSAMSRPQSCRPPAAQCPGPVPRMREILPCIWYLHLTCRATLAARQATAPVSMGDSHLVWRQREPHASSDRRPRATNGPRGFCMGTPESEHFLC